MSKEKIIVLVDDDEDALEQLGIILKSAGYGVRTATSREEAEELLLSVHPDLAILDLMMEHMDSGIVLCHTLKKLYPGLPVILLTAVTSATGLDLKPAGAAWEIVIPDKYRVGHEQHFAQVTEKFLRFLADGNMPGWEVPNMLAKYYTSTEAYRLSHRPR